uniref:Pept_C1 domain-containing protein n=1 Tax=Rhabditophanes sp. KR3021 TaxID=114890 RepID=A0AC35TKN5_9BILA
MKVLLLIVSLVCLSPVTLFAFKKGSWFEEKNSILASNEDVNDGFDIKLVLGEANHMNFDFMDMIPEPAFNDDEWKNVEKAATPFDDLVESQESDENEDSEESDESSEYQSGDTKEEIEKFTKEERKLNYEELHKQTPEGTYDLAKANFKGKCYHKNDEKMGKRTIIDGMKKKRPFEIPGFEKDLPKEFDWRNNSGINYCSPTRNQHLPVYCGSCWTFGTLGAMNDRFNIFRKNRWPMTMLSAQDVISCNGKGTCKGGEVFDVYEHGAKNGFVEEGCNLYVAVDNVCENNARCKTCWPASCDPVQNYTKYFIGDYGRVKGRENMMAEIEKNGPIACGMSATPKFDFGYTGGVYIEKVSGEINHVVSVSGWGVDKVTGIEYWIIRNSWGEAFGGAEKGWFKLPTSKYLNGTGNEYNLGIETDCFYADPIVEGLD